MRFSGFVPLVRRPTGRGSGAKFIFTGERVGDRPSPDPVEYKISQTSVSPRLHKLHEIREPSSSDEWV